MTISIPKFDQINPQQWIVWAFAGVVLLSVFGALATDQYALFGLPVVFLLLFVSVVDIKKIYWLLLFCIPLSVEVPISSSLATDLPTEPLMVLFLIVGLIFLITHVHKLGKGFLLHPLTLILLLHIGWTFACTIVSDLFVVSLKYSLAKLWYLVSFFFLARFFLKAEKDWKTFLWIILIPLSLATLITVVRHSFFGFSFDKANSVTWPFFRNHVTYAATLVLFLPFAVLGRQWYPKGHILRKVLWLLVGVLLVGIFFSYTRAAYISIFIAVGAYFVIRFKLTRLAVILSIGVASVMGLKMVQDNAYMHYAPEFKKTVTHYEFDNLVAATAKGEDISTMERVYRWVAGVFVIKAHPWMGVGPGNFYNFYQRYSLNAFSTYVSDNPDRSGIHNYYLLMGVEQGIPGMIFFLILIVGVLDYGERIYHQSSSRAVKNFVMAILLCFIIILALLLINDMIETDKVGSFFFLCIALLVNIDLHNRKVLSPKNQMEG
ncbi:MAG: O-antigen ligase family protein [Saprospiraceae bacterium]|nr:O-antigen ligase family protein [Saprospiraceae bacterium]